MNPIPHQFLISGTVLFLLSLLSGFAMPFLANPRMGVSAHVAAKWLQNLAHFRRRLFDHGSLAISFR